MKKILALLILIPSVSNAYNLIFNPFTGKLDYVGISTDSLATSAILNQSTLQAGATFYVSSGTVVNALNLYGDFKINNAGTDYVSYSTTTAKLRLINGATSLSTSLPLLLWNNNNIVGRFTGIGFAVGSSSSPLAYWYLDNQNNRFNMADGSGNVACYFDTLTFNLVCNYGITASTGTFGSATSTSFGNNPYVTINSSGSSEGLLVQGYGKPSGGYQNQLGLVTIISTTTGTPGSGVPQPLLVLVDSTTDPQLGTGLMEIWSNNSAHNDPIFWMHTNSPNSGPDMRVDSQAFNFEFVNLSTDNAHGMGKFEIAMANKGVDFQVNSRAYDNSTFENIAYWQALQKDKDLGPGLYIQPQNLTNDSGVMSSSSTSGIDFYTLNSHLVGLTGPKNVASGSWRFGLPSTPNNQGQVLYQSTNSDGTKFGDRQWEFTTGGATNFPLTSQGTGAPQWSTTLSSISVVGATSAVYELQVSSSATGFHVAVSTSGHFITSGGAPTISSCGSTPNGSVVGNDNEGIITVGGGSVTSCTLTFFSTWGATPTCVITDNSTAITGDISAISATAFTTSFSLSLGGGTIYYRCGCSGSLCR